MGGRNQRNVRQEKTADNNEFGKIVLIHVVPYNLGYFLISSNKSAYLILSVFFLSHFTSHFKTVLEVCSLQLAQLQIMHAI